MATDTTYNGWANYNTWNVSLWINHDEGTYRDMVSYARRSLRPNYSDFAATYLIPLAPTTGDGVAWNADDLDTDALDEMIAEAGDVG